MTSLFGRLLPLFVGARRVEDLFTEAVARLFERRPGLCLSWLDDLDLITPVSGENQRYIRITTQRTFMALDEHGSGSRPDLIVEVHHAGEDAELESPKDVVMIESKIGTWEGPEQLRRYAEHLNEMMHFGSKTLLYVTRGYDPKNKEEILSGMGENVRFEQLRWHDFYRFLLTVKKDALVEEVMAFMEEQGMARSYRFSPTDLIALSGVPRAFEILDETLGGEVRAKLESFAGNKVRRETHSIWEMRTFQRYLIRAFLHGHDLFCDLGYQLGKIDESAPASILRIPVDGYSAVFVDLGAQPGAVARETSVTAMKKVALNEGWEAYDVDNPAGWAGVRRVRSLASMLPEEDHVATVQRFFVESIHQLRAELMAFKKEHPDLPWAGG